MAEFASTVLSLTMIEGAWQDVLRTIHDHLFEHHDVPADPFEDGVLQVVDVTTRRIARTSPRPLTASLGTAPEGFEHWWGLGVELSFGSHRDIVTLSLREAPPGHTSIELWFPTKVHECLFEYDVEERSFDAEAKADLLRLCTGLTMAVGAKGYGVRFAGDDALLGPPSLDSLRDYVEIGDRWLNHPLQLLLAGVAATEVPDDDFEYDVDDPHPMHYRQGGSYIFDILWPREE